MNLKRIIAVCLLCASFSVMFIGGAGPAIAQDAPANCTAPELPPGTPTPLDADGNPIMEEGSPEAGPSDPGDQAMAEPVYSPADADSAAAARAGLDNVLACIAGGDYLGLAALLSPAMVFYVTNGANPYDVPASMEGVQPVRIVTEGEPVVDETGAVGLHLIYGDFFNGPGTLTSERWFMVEQDGYWKVDRVEGTPVPDGAFPDATILTIEMVDFAFALDQNEIPAGQVILRFVNSSYTHSAHVAGIVMLADGGVTAEDIIQMDDLPGDDQLSGFYGGVFVEPGNSIDLIFEDMQPGTYTMACDFATENHVPHFMLGMVAQFDVI